MKKISFIALVCLLTLSGCSSKYLTSSSNVSQEKKSYDKILIVAIAKDLTSRIRFENQVVSDFATKGITAASSVDVIKKDSFDKKLTEAEIDMLRNTLKQAGFDGIIITNLIDASQYTDVIPGNTNTAYYPARYGRFGRYYSYYPVTYWEPDQVVTGVKYTLESVLYDLRVDDTDNLQWVGRFQVKDPSSISKSVSKYSYELVNALMESSIQ
ncbi:hypothetical protein [Aureitalea marina]|uniref:DUF4136 domain-containing protein n=1 Tax=Aureitalea marina TaxID=930804 RepID=A0A2S7KMY8_9FLAO|nr:hypothetical protein [Aureitalea marina]PQB03971.1 hypothetical protein BST85_02910 [Aureitalea marina]